jgi:hypothetical protein
LLEIPVVATATPHLSPDCLVSISHGSYLTRTASREV